MKVQLKNVLPNPFRDMERYPIHPQKIEQLKKSVESTGFWDNVVARDAGQGKIEIAYGHHRLTALRELYDGEAEFEWIVRDLDDKEMLKIMAHENLDEWGHDSSIERETVRAVVKAFAEDRIYLPIPKTAAGSAGNAGQLRYAPSFCFASDSHSIIDRSRPYTADTIVGFLGGTMTIDTVKYTLRALCLIEQGLLTEDQLKGLTSNQAREVVNSTAVAARQAEDIKKEAQARAMSAPSETVRKSIEKDAEKKANAIVKSTVKAVSETLQKGGSKVDAKEAALKARVSITGADQKELPEINDAATRVASQLMRLLDPDYEPGRKIEELIGFKKHLSPTSLQNLDVALERVIQYAEGYRVRLK